MSRRGFFGKFFTAGRGRERCQNRHRLRTGVAGAVPRPPDGSMSRPMRPNHNCGGTPVTYRPPGRAIRVSGRGNMAMTSRSAGWLAAVAGLVLTCGPARAGVLHRASDLEALNRQLAGRVLDFTHNHGADNRIWSPALHEWRDLYVYLPPGFDPHCRYPVILYLHGLALDEASFVRHVAPVFDAAIARGVLPPCVIACPDGSIKGRPSLLDAGSFYINSKAGNFEDYIIDDVWPFIVGHFPVRPEREAHVIAGLSMGGFGAFNLGFKHPELFGVIVGIYPPLNLRWLDCHCRYMGNFDPNCWGWRTDFSRGHEPVGRFLGGAVTIRVRRLVYPLFGRTMDNVIKISRENPIEMLDTYAVRPGEFEMYVGYDGKDEFNIDAQVESFLYRACQLGLRIGVGYDPEGHHDMPTALRLAPGVFRWLAPRLAPYTPHGGP
jgi:S-formylglutathione hydrolase FrmB